MSKDNPRKAVAALLPSPIRIPALGVEVRPLTLAAWGLLEKTRSPMALGVDAGALDLVPTLYILTHDPAQCMDELADGSFGRRALAWADGLPVTALALLKDAALKQVSAMTAVIPGDIQKKTPNPRDITAGSPPSPNGPAAHTAGAGARRSTKRRPPSSPSTGGSPATPPAKTP